jgi:hypothetical protein
MSAGAATVEAGGSNFAEQVVSSALRYRAQAPLIEGLMKEVGLSGADLGGMVGNLTKPT